MRSRNIKPGFYKNEDLAECSLAARLIFPGLWMIADRMGRLEYRPKRIKGELLPFDNIDVTPLLDELSGWGLIKFYEVDGSKYIWIPAFLKHQNPHRREAKSTLPPHPEDSFTDSATDQGQDEAQPRTDQGQTKDMPWTDQGQDEPQPRTCSARLNPDILNPESIIKNTVSSVPEEDGECLDKEIIPEQPKEEKPVKNNYPADFNAFFQAFPHKDGVSKKRAYEAWRKARDKPSLQDLLAKIEILKRSDQWLRGIIPHPSTWLNGKCWETVGSTPMQGQIVDHTPRPEIFDPATVFGEGFKLEY